MADTLLGKSTRQFNARLVMTVSGQYAKVECLMKNGTASEVPGCIL
jgi:hypothetical protein